MLASTGTNEGRDSGLVEDASRHYATSRQGSKSGRSQLALSDDYNRRSPCPRGAFALVLFPVELCCVRPVLVHLVEEGEGLLPELFDLGQAQSFSRWNFSLCVPEIEVCQVPQPMWSDGGGARKRMGRKFSSTPLAPSGCMPTYFESISRLQAWTALKLRSTDGITLTASS